VGTGGGAWGAGGATTGVAGVQGSQLAGDPALLSWNHEPIALAETVIRVHPVQASHGGGGNPQLPGDLAQGNGLAGLHPETVGGRKGRRQQLIVEGCLLLGITST